MAVVNDAASTCASDSVKVTVNMTTEHKNIQVPALTVNPAEYTVAMVANGSRMKSANSTSITRSSESLSRNDIERSRPTVISS